MLDKLEKRFRRFAIPNVTIYLVVGQAFFFLVLMARHDLLEPMRFIPDRVLDGEVWRLITFLLVPPTKNVLFIFFELYLLWLFGTALENEWGAFRYNIYLLIACLGSMAVAFVNPSQEAINIYVYGSVFLAFAYLYPNFELLLFFVLPVKVKWLALITWVIYGLAFMGERWPVRLLILASIANFFLFFAGDMVRRVRGSARRRVAAAQHAVEASKPFHCCTKCGITDQSDPKMEFRYCPECEGTPCYCIDHIHDHEHAQGGVREADAGSKKKGGEKESKRDKAGEIRKGGVKERRQ